jgi:hypothetical protein
MLDEEGIWYSCKEAEDTTLLSKTLQGTTTAGAQRIKAIAC